MKKLHEIETIGHLRNFIMLGQPELGITGQSFRNLSGAETVDQAMRIREWVVSISNYSGRELLLDHGYKDLVAFIRELTQYNGGLWCAGVATLYMDVLYKAFNIPAVKFTYGYDETGLSHTTTLIGYVNYTQDRQKTFNFAILDAYLGFHYVDPDSNEILAIDELLKRVVCKEYKRIKRVDTNLKRPYVTHANEARNFRSWLFPLEIPEPKVYGDLKVYQGAVYNVENLFYRQTPMRDLADDVRGEQDLDEFLLDLMLVKPHFTRVNPECPDCYADNQLIRQAYKGISDGIARVTGL